MKHAQPERPHTVNREKLARAEQARFNAQLEAETRAAVRRLWTAGLSDNQIAKRLHVGRATVARHREALGLAANPLGGTFD